MILIIKNLSYANRITREDIMDTSSKIIDSVSTSKKEKKSKKEVSSVEKEKEETSSVVKKEKDISSVVCRFNCYCTNSDCGYKHYLSYDESKIMSKVINREKEEMKKYYEEQDEERRSNCYYGIMCHKKDCKYKHKYNPEGRKIINDLFKKEKQSSAKSKEKPTNRPAPIINITIVASDKDKIDQKKLKELVASLTSD